MRRPPRSTQWGSSAASDVYKRQKFYGAGDGTDSVLLLGFESADHPVDAWLERSLETVSYTHLRAHETVLDLVCRLLLENTNHIFISYSPLIVTTP